VTLSMMLRRMFQTSLSLFLRNLHEIRFLRLLTMYLLIKCLFTTPKNAQRWKFIFHRRLTLERERALGKEALECEVAMKLIKEVGLLKIVCKFIDFYEQLVKELLVNMPVDCDNPFCKDYQKVFVRGECVNFFPNIINKFLGIDEGGVAEFEVTDSQVSKEITPNQVKVWHKKRNISSGKLYVKYVILNRIGAANWVSTTHSSNIAKGLGKFIFAIGIKTKMDLGNYVFEQTVKHA